MAKNVTDILVSKGIISLEESGVIRNEAKKKGGQVDDILYARGISELDVVQAKSEISGYPVWSLEGKLAPYDLLREFPEESARHYYMVPLAKAEGYIDIGMLYPDDVSSHEALKFIAARYNLPARVFVITPSDYQKILSEYKNISGEVTKALGEFERSQEVLEEVVKKAGRAAITEEAPVTKMVGVVLRHAVEGGASDIHAEPSRDKLRIRFRVDGRLHTSLSLPMDIHAAFVTRIKVMTNMKIDETRIPQDGRFHAEIHERGIDFRVSTFPTSFGEKVVIRILDPEGGVKTLKELGFEERTMVRITDTIKRPFGMILITGPTGSGKSTTLYALLKMLTKEEINIVSLEDPIEYFIQGVNQSQVRPEIGYSFATGIRHIMRQDPDIIMVGEIRDKETALLAVHAALTGHLVLSTLHTNTSLGVIPRLIDMGVDPFLIPATLIAAIGQRLVRRLCPDVKKKVKISGRVKEILSKEIALMPDSVRETTLQSMPSEIYQTQVSPSCPKGSKGRVGIYEILMMTPELEKIILSSPSESKILEEARRQEMLTMRQDGIFKVLQGIIGLDELLEVI